MKYTAKTMKNSILVLAFLGVTASAVLAQQAELLGTRWQLTHINGLAAETNKAFLEFGTSLARFTGNAGCNRMSGNVTVSGGTIGFGSVTTTEMACRDAASDRTERSFLSNLKKVKRFRQSDSTLELLNGGRTMLRFKAAKSNTRLEDRKWMVREIAGEPMPVKGGKPFIVFDSTKSSAGGDTGCNVFGGSFEISGSKIRIFDTVSTMRACVEDDRMIVEREFMNALQNANQFEISGDKLFLYRGNELLVKFNGVEK